MIEEMTHSLDKPMVDRWRFLGKKAGAKSRSVGMYSAKQLLHKLRASVSGAKPQAKNAINRPAELSTSP